MKKVAILAENFYEEMELWYPYYRLQEAGLGVDLVGSEQGAVYKGKHGYPVTAALAQLYAMGARRTVEAFAAL